ESRVGRCIRTPDYLYSVYAPGKDGFMYMESDVYADDFLYDVSSDPDELHNLIADSRYAAVKQELRKKLLFWIEKYEHKTPDIIDG
ncbi:MAG TPA: arylsulfatase, partial [Candidatus Treponema faecavium]|nr:arylsulfatase [Candidatus Treponema faecavium]